DDRVVQPNTNEGGKQMFGRRDENALLLQAGGITHTSYIAAYRLDFKAIKIDPAEYHACASRSGKNSQIDRSAAVQPNATAGNSSSDCLFVWQVVSDE